MDSSPEVPADKTGVGRGVTVGIRGGVGALSTRQLAIGTVGGSVLGLAGRVREAGECGKNSTVEIASMDA